MFDRLPQFMSAPTLCQFAKDGAWESAWSFPSGRLPPASELAAYLSHRTELAFEAFFGRSFFGARITGSTLEVEAFATQCFRAVRAQQSFFDVLRHELGCPVPSQPPAFAEIGCVDAWRSVGAIRVVEPQLATSEFERLWFSLLDSSVNRNTRHAKAIEFAFEAPVAHWFGLPISTPGEPNSLSESMLRQALGLGLPLPLHPIRNAP